MSDTPDSPPMHNTDVPSLVSVLRERAALAKTSASRLFVMLVTIIVLGIGYYIGVPLYQSSQQAIDEAAFSSAQAEVADAQKALDDLDAQRDAAFEAVAGSVESVWTPSETGVPGTLLALDSLPDGQTLVAVGWGGAFARSRDGGETWTAGETGVTDPLWMLQALPDGQTLVAVGDRGAFARSRDGGETWRTGETGVTGTLWALQVLPDGQTLVAVGDGGAFARSGDGGETWTVGKTGVTGRLYALQSLPDGQTLLAVGSGGAFARSRDGGETWTSGATGVIGTFYALQSLPDGQTLVAVGEGGAFARSTDGGESWTVGTTGVSGILWALHSLPDSQTLVAVGDGGAFARSRDGGETWTVGETGVPGVLVALQVLPDGQTLVAVGEDGAFARLDDRYARALRASLPEIGRATDAALLAALDALPSFVREIPATVTAIVAFRDVWARRDALELDKLAAEKTRDEIQLGSLERTRAEEAFRTFMATCRTGAPDAQEVTAACVGAYTEIHAQEAATIWERLAEQLPPAVLLLFLLATLGGLYRYNLRLAGFHDSRADALEMLDMKFADKDIAQLDALALALAADKVEFGKGNTPSDQALEIAKAVLSRSG